MRIPKYVTMPVADLVAKLRAMAEAKARKARDPGPVDCVACGKSTAVDSQWRIGGACALLDAANQFEEVAGMRLLEEEGKAKA